MKSIILKGGLGNQLFQLCLYFELKNHSRNEKIFIDSKTGCFPQKYKRNWELKNLYQSNIKYKFSSF